MTWMDGCCWKFDIADLMEREVFRSRDPAARVSLISWFNKATAGLLRWADGQTASVWSVRPRFLFTFDPGGILLLPQVLEALPFRCGSLTPPPG